MKILKPLCCLICLLSVIMFSPNCWSAVQGEVDPYQVTLFKGNDFTAQILDVKLPAGMRMLKIPVINGVPRSALIGSKVGILLFPDNNFYSQVNKSRAHDEIGIGRDHFLVPFFRFSQTLPAIDYGRDPGTGRAIYFGRDVCSMIVYRQDIHDMLGIFLQWSNGKDNPYYEGQFFPLPDNPAQADINYIKFQSVAGPMKIDFVAGGYGTLYNAQYIEVTITSSPGHFVVKFPDPKKPISTNTSYPQMYDLASYGINQIASMHLRYVGPYTAQAYNPKLPITPVALPPEPDRKHLTAPPAPDKVHLTAPPTSEPSQTPSAATTPAPTKIVRVPPPASAPPPTTVARTAAPAAVTPAAPAVPDVSGQWKSSVNRVYNIKQTNNRFQWTVVNDTEVGEGVVSEKDIYASWKGKMGPGSINGKITSVDSKGKATQILWNNGVWFNR